MKWWETATEEGAEAVLSRANGSRGDRGREILVQKALFTAFGQAPAARCGGPGEGACDGPELGEG